MGISEFAAAVAKAEGGIGTVYVGGFYGEPSVVGVCCSGEVEPEYVSDIRGTDDNIRAVGTALEQAGFSVILGRPGGV